MPDTHWSLSIELPRRRLGALTQRLAELGYPTFEEQPIPGAVRIIVYATAREALLALEGELRRAPVGGAPPGALRFALHEVAPDWALAWTQHLSPVALTPTLTLYPWRPAGAIGPGELYLEPAFAFGFGEHASTRLVAGWLEAACRAAPGASVLDVGCGTGVLSLLARRSGAGRVLGVDISEAAIAAARSNAELNQLQGVCFERGSVADVAGQFERVVANIEAPVLCQLADGIASRLAPGGELGLAGFISEQCEGVVRRFAGCGVRLELQATREDWCLLVGARPGGEPSAP